MFYLTSQGSMGHNGYLWGIMECHGVPLMPKRKNYLHGNRALRSHSRDCPGANQFLQIALGLRDVTIRSRQGNRCYGYYDPRRIHLFVVAGLSYYRLIKFVSETVIKCNS